MSSKFHIAQIQTPKDFRYLFYQIEIINQAC